MRFNLSVFMLTPIKQDNYDLIDILFSGVEWAPKLQILRISRMKHGKSQRMHISDQTGDQTGQ